MKGFLIFSILLAVYGAIKVESQFDYIVQKSDNCVENPIELLPKGEHQYTLIFMHGLSNSGEHFRKQFESQPDMRITPLNMKIVLPTAHVMTQTSCGLDMTAWFDFTKMPLLDKGEPVSEQKIQSRIGQDGLDSSANYLLSLVDKEANILDNDPRRVFIGGFSQGAMVSLAAFLKYKGEKHLGGVIPLSGTQGFNYTKYVHFQDKQEKDRIDKLRRETPMLLYHGSEDPYLPFNGAFKSYEYLRNKVYHNSDNLQFIKEDDMDHSISEIELNMVGKFLHKLTNQNQITNDGDVKFSEPKLDEAISTLQKHIDSRALRQNPNLKHHKTFTQHFQRPHLTQRAHHHRHHRKFD